MKYTEEEKQAIETAKIVANKKYGSIMFLEIKDVEIILNLVEKQQKQIDRLKSKTQIISPLYIKENYIPKEAIREKIKELEPYIYKGENAPQDFLQYRVKAKIQGYKELLKESD